MLCMSTSKQSSYLLPLLPLMLLCQSQLLIIHLLHQILFIHRLISLTVAVVLGDTAVDQQGQQDEEASHTMEDEPWDVFYYELIQWIIYKVTK